MKSLECFTTLQDSSLPMRRHKTTQSHQETRTTESLHYILNLWVPLYQTLTA